MLAMNLWNVLYVECIGNRLFIVVIVQCSNDVLIIIVTTALFVVAPDFWNSLLVSMHDLNSEIAFKRTLKVFNLINIFTAVTTSTHGIKPFLTLY